MRSPLGRVRGLGSAKEGVGHWTAQRLTAIALVPLSVWFIFSMIVLIGVDHDTFAIWLGEHGNGLLMIVFVVVLCHHTQLGLQVVIEDYVKAEGPKLAGLIAVKFVAVLAAASAVLAVLRLAIGA
jgi:succinate dehydrogenase / fumarate reductase membrane anchor subunit